jgi:hypothetical protein
MRKPAGRFAAIAPLALINAARQAVRSKSLQALQQYREGQKRSPGQERPPPSEAEHQREREIAKEVVDPPTEARAWYPFLWAEGGKYQQEEGGRAANPTGRASQLERLLALERSPRPEQAQTASKAQPSAGNASKGLSPARQRRIFAGAGVDKPLLPPRRLIRPLLHLNAPGRWFGEQEERSPLLTGQAARNSRLGSRHHLLGGSDGRQPRGLVHRRGDDALAVGAERRAIHSVLMADQRRADLFAALGVPQPRGLVEGRGDDALAVGAERRGCPA